jgi:excisionase family DNA binding protein
VDLRPRADEAGEKARAGSNAVRGQSCPLLLLLVSMSADVDRPLTRTDVLSTSEVAELLGIPRSTVHELARRGELPARRVGRRWLFLRDRLAAAIAPLDEPDAWRPERNAQER